MEKVLIISYGKLILNGSAGNTVMCGIVDAALQRGFDVTYLGLVQKQELNNREDIDYTPNGTSSKLRVFNCSYKISSAPLSFLTKLKVLIDLSLNQEIINMPESLNDNYDYIIAFDYLAIKIAKLLEAKKKFFIMGDPPVARMRINTFQTLGLSRPHLYLKLLFLKLLEKQHWTANLQDSGENIFLGMFGSRHANDWSKLLGQQIIDLRPMIPAVENIDKKFTYDTEKIRIVFGGTLEGTASRLTYNFFKKKFLPQFNRELINKHSLTIIGSCPDFFLELFKRYSFVEIKGKVNSFENELLKADIFILPMRYPVGVRTRICSALQAGCYCVCDNSVLQNMPELKNCGSVMFAQDIDDYMTKIKSYPFNEQSQIVIKKESHGFFMRNYCASEASKKILNALN